MKFALVFIASGTGGLARYVFGGWVQRLSGGTFPLGTLVVNVSGCLLIGFFGGAALTGRSLIREEYRVALLVGLLGGYTTFSTFGWETFSMLGDGQFGRALLNAAASVVAGVVAVWAGYRVAEFWLGA